MIHILVSTYNGEKYLEEQLDSLLKQEGVEYEIIVRDDGSTDTTCNILSKWGESKKLRWFSGKNIGVKDSFLDLLSKAPDNGYYAFCDQDDYWFKNKMFLSLEKMKECECSYPDKPIIVHTDMNVVDQNLKILHPSFWKISKFRPEILNTFNNLAACNGLNGCTMMLNNQARKLILEKKISQNVVIHDVLCSLIVSANGGIIDYVNKPTMYYRQHSLNVVGVKPYSFFDKFKKIKNIKRVVEDNLAFWRVLNQVGRISIWQYVYRKIYYYIIR